LFQARHGIFRGKRERDEGKEESGRHATLVKRKRQEDEKEPYIVGERFVEKTQGQERLKSKEESPAGEKDGEKRRKRRKLFGLY
jgi:hypothetical protein